MRLLRVFVLAVLAAGPLAALGVDAPHLGFDNCSSCHMGHSAPGAGLTKEAGNFTLCNSCHSSGTSLVTGITGPATPGVSGRSHRWDALASNLGATPPSASSSDPAEAEMGMRLDNGKLMCSTCHDQHKAGVFSLDGRGKQHVSAPQKSLGGDGALTVTSVASGATAKGYLLDFVAGGSASAARFRLSNDAGLSWFGCSGSAPNYSYPAWDGTNGCQPAPSIQLNDGANVTVSFSGTSYVLGNQWKFYVSYPFMRVDNTDAKMCTTCHKDRNMSAANVEGTGPHQGTGGGITPGTTVFHHPVGPTVVPAAMLDANGGAPGTDGIATNDLVLGKSGGVTCLTCHRVHKVDSNSLTEDQ